MATKQSPEDKTNHQEIATVILFLRNDSVFLISPGF